MSQPYPYYTTMISPEQSQGEITRMLYNYGCQATRWTTDKEGHETTLEFLWDIKTDQGKKTFGFRIKPPMLVKKSGEPHPAATMRLLKWYLKSKLEAVKYGLIKMEEEFLQSVVVPLPGGHDATVGEVLVPQIQEGKVMGIRDWIKALPKEAGD